MAAGTYKNGVQIKLVYQAAGLLANAIPVGSVFDEAGALDGPKSTSLTSQLLLGELTGAGAGRYLGHFTPDAEGRWTIVIKDKNSAGPVSKVYEVCGHDVDTIGDGITVTIPSSVASQLLLTQSAVNAATASDLLLLQSTLSGYISNVESAVDLIASPAMVS
jgi:hypothetical protein